MPPEGTRRDETKFTNDRATYEEGSSSSFNGLNLSSVLEIAMCLAIKVWVQGVEECYAVAHARESQ